MSVLNTISERGQSNILSMELEDENTRDTLAKGLWIIDWISAIDDVESRAPGSILY